MPALEIYFFGQFEALRNGQKIEHPLWQSRQVRSILKYLVAAPGQPIASSKLVEFLWPEEDPASGQRRLYVRISQLRKVLENPQGHEWIKSVEGAYVLQLPETGSDQAATPVCWIDVVEFENLCQAGRTALEKRHFPEAISHFEAARTLYRGDYLVEDLYLDWTIAERERLHDLHLISLTELAEAYAQSGAYRRAINVCRQILSIEPCREAVFVRLMLYYYYAGEKGKALQVFQQCQQVLRQELGVEADQTSMGIAERIEAGNLWSQSDLPHYPPPSFEGRIFEVPYSLGETPFIGREREYAWLIQQWSQPAARTILLEGEAGIGKTRLADEFCGYAELNGKHVFKIRGLSLENQPYAAWVKFLDDEPNWLKMDSLSITSREVLQTAMLYREVEFSEHEPGNLIPTAPRYQLRAALLELLQKMLVDGSLLYVDDAQYLDTESLSLLAELLSKITTLLVCRSEDTPAGHPLRRLLEGSILPAPSLILRPIQLEAVQELLFKLGSAEIPELAEKLFEATEGNPLFLIATLQHLFEEGILYVNIRGEWESSGDFSRMLSPSIEQIIARRLRQVRNPERRLLDVIAVAGGEIDYELLRAVLEVEESSLLQNADTLIDLGLLMEPRMPASAELALPHACYGEVLYQSLPAARRRIYHHRLANGLIQTGKASDFQAVLLAHHLFHGGEYAQAVQYLQRAGDLALRLYTPQQARAMYLKALDWLEQVNPSERAALQSRLHLGIAEALRYSGDYTAAARAYQAALPTLDGELRTVAAYQIFQMRVLQGAALDDYDELTREFEEVFSQSSPSWALALLYWGQTFTALLKGDPKETRRINAQAWRVARQIAQQEKPPAWICQRAFTILMRAHNQWGNYRTSIRFSKRILQLSADNGHGEDQNSQAVTHAALGEAYFYLGQYHQAKDKFSHCLQIAEKAGDPRLQGDALTGLGAIQLAKGDFEGANRYALQVLELVSQNNDVPRQVNAGLLMAEIKISKDPQPEMVTRLESFLELARYQGAQPYCVRILLILAQANIALNEIDKAQTYAREALEMAERCSLKRHVSIALRLLADIKRLQGGFESGSRFAERAAALARRIETPLEHAQALVSWAAMHPDKNQREKLLQQASSIFYQLGAEFEIARVRRQLQDLSNVQ